MMSSLISRSGLRAAPQDNGSGEIVLAIGIAIAFGVLGLLVLWIALQVGMRHQAEWTLVLAPVLALSVLGTVLAGSSRRHADAEAAARAGEARYRLVAENASDMIVLADLDTTRRYVSPACRELLGFEPYELIGTRPLEGVHPEDAERYGQILERLTEGKEERVTSRQRYRRKDGSWVWTEATFRLVRDDWGRLTGYVASVRDITERHALEEQLREQARTDAVTGLSNRRALEERLEEEWRRAHRTGSSLALLSLDIDYFKGFNDHFGHAAGDDCLKEVAAIIRRGRRASDFTARFGGEEFVVILPETGAEGAQVVAESIRRKLEAAQIPHPASRYGIVTASIGVAACKAAEIGSAAELLKVSDAAMYQAKQMGRNQVAAWTRPEGAAADSGPTALVA